MTAESGWKELKAAGLVIRPIGTWPGRLRRSSERKAAPFAATLESTLKLLATELKLLRARNVVLEIALGGADLRQDGLPYARAVLEHPGVILSFNIPLFRFRRAFDGLTTWQHCLRALALNLNHLRMADTYGVESGGQQYRGWIMPEERTGESPPQPPPRAQQTGTAGNAPPTGRYTAGVTPAEVVAAGFLSRHTAADSRRILTEPAYMEEAVKAAQIALHPDRYVGAEAKRKAHEFFVRIEPAAEILRKRFR